jgi:hypothetical protein
MPRWAGCGVIIVVPFLEAEASLTFLRSVVLPAPEPHVERAAYEERRKDAQAQRRKEAGTQGAP